MRSKKMVSLLLTVVMLCSMTITAFADYSDMGNHWASRQIEDWTAKGVIQGYGGKFNPEDFITRGDLAMILDRVLKYQVAAENSFTDLEEAYYTEAILKAKAAGIISGDEKSARPMAYVTRQEAAVVLAKVFGLNTEIMTMDMKYKDTDIADWAMSAIWAMSNAGYMNGNEGLFRPTEPITRAELMVIIDRAVQLLCNEAKTYTQDIKGNVIVNVSDVVLKDMTIEGNLILAEGIGSGKVILDNVKVEGYTIVKGGENSIIIKGNSQLTGMVVAKKDGNVTVNLQGNTKVSFIKIEENGATIIVDKGALIESAIVNAGNVMIKGEGKVENAKINASGVKIETIGTKVEVAEGIEKPTRPNPPTHQDDDDDRHEPDKVEIKSYGNEFEIGTTEEFLSGTFRKIGLDSTIGDGAIVLREIDGKYEKEGIYESQIIDVPNFEYMVASWNSDTPEGTQVEIQAKVLVNHVNENGEAVQTWSEWLSWGQWSPHIGRASADTAGSLAETSTDELVIRGSDGETACKVQMRAILRSNGGTVTPTLRYLHGTLKNTIEGQTIEKVWKDEFDESAAYRDIETPEYSQMIRCPRIAKSICSPTTITMIMNGKGESLLPEEVAQNTYDNNYGFGNWAFAAASAGSYGYKSYVDYTTMEGLKREIAKGYPVGASVKYSNEPNHAKYPYVEGAPGNTGGHLIVVRGFVVKDGIEYAIVNDSYAPENETVRREYKVEQFEKAWSNRVAYIIREKEENAGFAPTMRIESGLKATNVAGEYAVFAEGERIETQNFGGTIAYTTDNDHTYQYFPKMKDKNTLTFTEEEIASPDLKVYVITDTGKVYITTQRNLDREPLLEVIEETMIESVEPVLEEEIEDVTTKEVTTEETVIEQE